MMKLVVLALCVAAVFSQKVTVTVKDQGLDKAAMKLSLLTNKYCSVSGKQVDVPYRSQFAPDLDQCLSRCNRDLLCLSADYTTEKSCNLHKIHATVGQLGSGGTHYHRMLKAENGCPSGTTLYVSAAPAYSKSFCKIADKKCPGHDLYRKSQNLGDMTKCMEKCAKIKSCASADYNNGKCAPKDHACTTDELVEEIGATFMMRLGKDESECPAGSKDEAAEKLKYDCTEVGNSNPFEKPGDCDFFYQCSNGVMNKMPCAPGTAFNPVLGVCDWPKNVLGCGLVEKVEETVEKTKTEVDCSTIKHTRPFEKPGDCANFYQCGPAGELITHACPHGLAFNPALTVCDWPSEVPGC